MLVLSKADVRAALPMDVAIEAAREACIADCSGRATIPLRDVVHSPDGPGISLFMPGYVARASNSAARVADRAGAAKSASTDEATRAAQSESILGAKIVSIFENNPRVGLGTTQAVFLLISPTTGETLAVIEAGSLTAIRTGAASGAATDLFARPESSVATIFGAGGQARTQLEALAFVRPLEQVYVCDVDVGRAEVFAEEMQARLQTVRPGIRVLVAQNPEDALARSHLVSCATTSRTPLFFGQAINPGTHVNAIGSYTPDRRELDETLLLRAGKVVVDSREAVLAEAGDFIIPIRQGVFGPDIIVAQLGEVLLGEKPVRESASEITVYKAVGVATLDLVAARTAYSRATKLGLGTQIRDFS